MHLSVDLCSALNLYNHSVLLRESGFTLCSLFLKQLQSEAIGVIVMERCAVELDPREELPYSFILGTSDATEIGERWSYRVFILYSPQNT